MSEELKMVPMGKLLNLIEISGYKMEYQYDDLVFIDNTSILFRFDLNDYETVYLHFNNECVVEAREKLIPFLLKIAKDEDLKLKVSSTFTVRQKEGTEELEISF